MSRRIRVLTLVALALALASWSSGTALGDAPADPGRDFGLSHRPVCGPAPPGAARCHADVVTGAAGEPHATNSYMNGYEPLDLVHAYSLPSGGSGQTVAIVDAYDNPNAETDLATYRSTFHLAPCASGCFRKINQHGETTSYPRGDVGWGQEIALDLDMASAICPDCDILLVEADSNSFADLAAAVDMAATSGATVISNSYGGPEFRGEATWESHYINHPGVVAITVSSGDSGYGVEFPAASQYVTAVGGTRLTQGAGGEWTETVWSGAGSGCSAYVLKPAWQTDKLTCSRRTVADVAAVADPSTGVAVYDSYGATGGANWSVFGGTSVAAPIIAGVYALAGNTLAAAYGSRPYAAAGSLFDVTSGSNGRCSNRRTASLAYLCTGGRGYDGPTGLGTPNGVGAFRDVPA